MFLPAYINPLVDDVVVGSDDKNNWQTSLWTASGIYAHSRPVFSLQSTFTEEEQTDLAYYQELIDYATSSRAKFINGDVELNESDITRNGYIFAVISCRCNLFYSFRKLPAMSQSR